MNSNKLERTPDILCLQFSAPLKETLSFPAADNEVLNMSYYMTQSGVNNSFDTMYKLYAVTNRSADGHHSAYCKHPKDGKWRHFDDEKVSELNTPICTKDAVVLYYRRASLN